MRRKPDLSFLEEKPVDRVGGKSCTDDFPALLPEWWALEQKYIAVSLRMNEVKQMRRPVTREASRPRPHSSVRVHCLEHPEWGPLTINEMAGRIDISPKRVRNAVRLHHLVKQKLRVLHVDEEWRGTVKSQPKTNRCTKRRPVICDRYGWFPSSSQASKFLKLQPSAVAISIYKDHECGGVKWRWATVDEGITAGQRDPSAVALADVRQPVRKGGTKKKRAA